MAVLDANSFILFRRQGLSGDPDREKEAGPQRPRGPNLRQRAPQSLCWIWLLSICPSASLVWRFMIPIGYCVHSVRSFPCFLFFTMTLFALSILVVPCTYVYRQDKEEIRELDAMVQIKRMMDARNRNRRYEVPVPADLPRFHRRRAPRRSLLAPYYASLFTCAPLGDQNR